jgi:hypothetical protein
MRTVSGSPALAKDALSLPWKTRDRISIQMRRPEQVPGRSRLLHSINRKKVAPPLPSSRISRSLVRLTGET